MKLLLPIASLFLTGAFVIRIASAQELITERNLSEAIRVLDKAPSKNSLPCSIDLRWSPRLDFMFRYIGGFAIECRFGAAIRPGTKLVALLRITPKGDRPTLMIGEFDVPQAQPSGPTGMRAALSRLRVWMSGAFALGPGSYLLEVVLMDDHGHTCRKQRTLKAGGLAPASRMHLALPAGAVAPLAKVRWNGALVKRGLRVTVLVHAYSRTGASLHATDRAYLLQSLAAVLNQISCQSIKLIAFNLDRQEEIFRQDNFDGDGFTRLEGALKQVEFVTIPYRALSPHGWANFLVEMTRPEAISLESPDVIIFLGPWGSHEQGKMPAEAFTKLEVSHSRIFYLKYFSPPGGFPDGVEQLTKELHGSVFAINSPHALAQAIKKMQSQMIAEPKD